MNTIVVGLDYPFIRNVVLQLESEHAIYISKWFVSKETDEEGLQLKNSIHWRRIFSELKNKGELLEVPDDLHSCLYGKLFNYLDQLVRESYFENRTLPENLNVINLYIKYLYNLLVKQNIGLVLFADAPHGAYAPILYDIAHYLKIKTLILFPCYMRDRFLYCYDLKDIGMYSMNMENNDVEIEDDSSKLFSSYEKDVFWAPEKKSGICNLKNVIENKIQLIKDVKEKYDDTNDYVYRHIIRSASRKSKKHVFKINSERFSQHMVDGEKFVYFPLHLQPEMTTSTLGGIYNDQVLAIERLRRIIPDDWYIYVKENPLQTYEWRDKYFYERLELIKNLRFIDYKTSTYELIAKSMFVATITGTAGFEAVSGGKPALVFGLAWYRSLPGVCLYNSKVKLADIMRPFTVDEVREGFERIEKNFVKAVVAQEVYEYADINIMDNQNRVYQFLKRTIDNIQ